MINRILESRDQAEFMLMWLILWWSFCFGTMHICIYIRTGCLWEKYKNAKREFVPFQNLKAHLMETHSLQWIKMKVVLSEFNRYPNTHLRDRQSLEEFGVAFAMPENFSHLFFFLFSLYFSCNFLVMRASSPNFH